MENEPSAPKRPIWLACVAGALVGLCLCSFLILAASVFVINRAARQGGQAPLSTVQAATPQPPPELTATPSREADETTPAATPFPSPTRVPAQTATPVASSTRPAAQGPFAEEREEIEANVSDLRGLEALEPVEVAFLDTEELRQRLEADSGEEYGPQEARYDTLVLSAFDFLPADYDLYTLTLDLLTEQVAGFYDIEADEFVIVSDDDEFDGIEQLTHAHEYMHALQDQHYDLALLEDHALDSERRFAVRALAEGEATLLQLLYLQEGYFSQQEVLELLASLGEVDTAVLDSAPPVIRADLAFAYDQGLAFVQALYDQGGFAAVADAWANLPESSEHIIHLDRYRAGDTPQVVAVAPLTDTLGSGWAQIDEDSLGEFYLRQYLGQQLDDEAVETAATGWGGDRYRAYWNEGQGQLALALRQTWDSAGDRDEFAAGLTAYQEARTGAAGAAGADGGLCWTAGDVVCLYLPGEASLLVRAPSRELAAQIAAAALAG
ncbi:MAG: hypothetical protein ACRDHL_09365 [Candidatus Promineifilaceae bacterium]